MTIIPVFKGHNLGAYKSMSLELFKYSLSDEDIDIRLDIMAPGDAEIYIIHVFIPVYMFLVVNNRAKKISFSCKREEETKLTQVRKTLKKNYIQFSEKRRHIYVEI